MFTTSGFVSDGCGHQHETLRSAVKCLLRHRRYDRYSDRTVKQLIVDPDSESGYREELLGVDDTLRVHQLAKQEKNDGDRNRIQR